MRVCSSKSLIVQSFHVVHAAVGGIQVPSKLGVLATQVTDVVLHDLESGTQPAVVVGAANEVAKRCIDCDVGLVRPVVHRRYLESRCRFIHAAMMRPPGSQVKTRNARRSGHIRAYWVRQGT